jgi:hypothetical protein
VTVFWWFCRNIHEELLWSIKEGHPLQTMHEEPINCGLKKENLESYLLHHMETT